MDALIGHSGFVGSTLRRSHRFDAMFRSQDIESIAGQSYRMVVCAGAPAEKWKANADPLADRANLARLMASLRSVKAERFILISTVDVYPDPVAVDELSEIDAERAHPYGRHRYELECFVRDRFDALILRLPGLYGTGLKKNAIYDLLHDRQVERIDARGCFQFYGVHRLWQDIQTTLTHALPLVNLPTEPVTIREVARVAFRRQFDNEMAAPPARYDVRTRHAALFGGDGDYIETAERVLEGIARFIQGERRA